MGYINATLHLLRCIRLAFKSFIGLTTYGTVFDFGEFFCFTDFLSGFLFRVRDRVRVEVGVGGGFRVRVRVRASIRAR